MDAVAGEGSGTNERRGQREEWDHMNAVPGGDDEGEPLCIRSGIGKWREVGPSTHTQTTHTYTLLSIALTPPSPLPPRARNLLSQYSVGAMCSRCCSGVSVIGWQCRQSGVGGRGGMGQPIDELFRSL